MNRVETVQVLAKMAAYDRRKTGEADVLAWHEILEPYDLTDALAAVTAHFAESTDWCMPAHITRHVKALRSERLKAVGTIVPNPGTDALTETRALHREITSGRMTPADVTDYETAGRQLTAWQASRRSTLRAIK